MKHHRRARTTVITREELAKAVLEGRLSLNDAAAAFKISRQSAGKWVKRYRDLGVAGLEDRSSRPHHLAHQSPAELVERVERMRREGWTGLRIAETTGLSSATVSRMLTRLRLNKKHMIEPKPPPVRYEHAAPGDLLHIDIKKFARIVKAGHRITGNPQDETRGAGWEFLYVAVDDHSRIAYTALYPDEKAVSSADFMAKAAAYFKRFGIAIRQITVHAFWPTCSAMPAMRSTSCANAPASTGLRPTARPNASSRPPSGSGPMPDATKTPENDSRNCSHGHTSTTGIDHTPVSATNRPSADQDST
jgi:transposase